DGGVLQSLGAAAFPTWSPDGTQLLYQDLNGGHPRVAVWTRGDGSIALLGAGAKGVAADTPVGWWNGNPFYLRQFEDGRAGLHQVNAGDAQPYWSADALELAGDRPIMNFDGGVLLPTTAGWALADQGGGNTPAGDVTGGSASQAVASPDGSQIAYAAGDRI